jgi:hypothetical protein
MGCTDIGQIHMAVHIVIDDIPAFAFSHLVGHSAQPGDIVAVKQPYAILTGKPFPALNLFFYILILFCS